MNRTNEERWSSLGKRDEADLGIWGTFIFQKRLADPGLYSVELGAPGNKR
jgi:hypothetical protein